MKRRIILSILVCLSIVSSMFVAGCGKSASYPVLPANATYYETTYPSGLVYSQGWYGTLGHSPDGGTIWLYDDNNGICLFSFPASVTDKPSGAQGGTTLTSISLSDAKKLVKSYPLSDYKAIPSEVLANMTNADYFVGVWGGNKLAQKFLTPQADTETILSDAQVKLIAEKQQSNEILFDPPRYFVLATGNNNWSSTGTWDSLTSVYATGTATFTNASTDVTGSGTTWTSGMNGDYIVSTTNTLYKISTVNSTTDLTLTGNYVQPTLTGSAYIIGTLATTASVPTSADSVYPGTIATGATLTVDAAAACLNMDWTGATNSPTLAFGTNALSLYGDITGIATLNTTYTSGNGLSTHNVCHVTSNGCVWNVGITVASTGNTLILSDNFISTSSISLRVNCTLTTNNHTVTLTTMSATSSYSGQIFTLGSSVINCASWYITSTTATVTANTATINCSSSFAGGGANYNGATVNLTGASPTISGNNSGLTLNGTPATTQTIKFTDGTTQTVTASNLSGTAGHVHTLQGTSTAGWNITKAGGGTVFADYVTIVHSVATPASTWYYGSNSTYTSTSGWNFNAITSVLGVLYKDIGSIMGVSISSINTVLGIH